MSISEQVIRATVPFRLRISECSYGPGVEPRYDFSVTLWGTLKDSSGGNGRFSTRKLAERAGRSAIRRISAWQPVTGKEGA